MKIINLCLFLLLGLMACDSSAPNQNDVVTTTQPQDQKVVDANIIAAYAKENGLNGKTTPSGLFYVIEKEGEGPSAKDLMPSSQISVHYHGTFLDGKVFDSSVDRGEAFDFQLGQVIPGWQEGIKLLNQGGKGTFIVPSHLAYGERGFSKLIKPNTVLRFDVELIEI